VLPFPTSRADAEVLPWTGGKLRTDWRMLSLLGIECGEFWA
jgi:hypothetical protein